MVAHAGDHPWSMYGANSVGRLGPRLTPHSEYLSLGPDSMARAATYRALFADALPDDLVEEIRCYLQQQKALGTDRLSSWVEARTGQLPGVRQAGSTQRSPNCH